MNLSTVVPTWKTPSICAKKSKFLYNSPETQWIVTCMQSVPDVSIESYIYSVTIQKLPLCWEAFILCKCQNILCHSQSGDSLFLRSKQFPNCYQIPCSSQIWIHGGAKRGNEHAKTAWNQLTVWDIRNLYRVTPWLWKPECTPRNKDRLTDHGLLPAWRERSKVWYTIWKTKTRNGWREVRGKQECEETKCRWYKLPVYVLTRTAGHASKKICFENNNKFAHILPATVTSNLQLQHSALILANSVGPSAGMTLNYSQRYLPWLVLE